MTSTGTLAKYQNKAILFKQPSNQWSESLAQNMSDAELLLYRSNLLGSDLAVTNFGGGNTSAKLKAVDPLTQQQQQVLWVKGSGGDLGSMTIDGFASLYLDKILSLENLYQGADKEDEMVGYLPHCIFNNNNRAPSIDTPLHGYLPYKHIDHLHPDAIIALCASSYGEKASNDIWGGDIGWLAWRRPGFELGLQLRDFAKNNPHCKGVMLAGHGIISWADTAKDCYDLSIKLINDAVNYLNKQFDNTTAFGGPISTPLTKEKRHAIAASVMPKLRSLMSQNQSKIGHFSDDDETLEFVCSRDFEKLAKIGTSCPDHFLRTKIAPMTLDHEQLDNTKYLETCLKDYRRYYQAYYDRNTNVGDPAIRDANPVIILIPGIGRISFAENKKTARLAGEFYGNAINVMRGAETIGHYIGLDENEAYRIEYWALEEAKLQRLPRPKPLAGKIALVTGGAGGIGNAVAEQLLEQGACVLLADFAEDSLKRVNRNLSMQFGSDSVKPVVCDVTCEEKVTSAFKDCALAFGGLDILVANAGIASSAPIEETSRELWHKNYSVLAEGYFLTARAAFPLMKQQGNGSIVFIGSKNGVAAAKNASAYASAKAASLHLARCLALEGAEFGIRVNSINPDAVIKGSSIWNGSWRQERAGAHGIDAGEALETHYRNRSLLKRDVLPIDIAKAVYFLASNESAKTTGNMINVDAGNTEAFVR